MSFCRFFHLRSALFLCLISPLLTASAYADELSDLQTLCSQTKARFAVSATEWAEDKVIAKTRCLQKLKAECFPGKIDKSSEKILTCERDERYSQATKKTVDGFKVSCTAQCELSPGQCLASILLPLMEGF